MIRGNATFYLLPLEGGAPKGGGWLPNLDENSCWTSAAPYRHPERSRGIFLAQRKNSFSGNRSAKALLLYHRINKCG